MNRIELRRPFGVNALVVDGERIKPGPSLRLRNHSPTGFSWGYGGSGPAQTALAILLAVTGDPEEAQRWYQSFKRDVLERLAQDEDHVFDLDVKAWIASCK